MLKVNREILLEALSIVNHAVAKKASMPVTRESPYCQPAVTYQNEYNDMIDLLRTTPTSMDKDSINAFLRVELDKLIKEYQDKIERNQESIDYYNFITDVEI